MTGYYLLALFVAIILHEISHGWAALAFGDTTARDAGRLTLNPIPHIDPVGTILLPVLLTLSGLPIIGWAKPVPVNVSRLRRPRSHAVWVSLAGPATNAVLSFVGWILCRLALALSPGASALNYGGSFVTVNLNYSWLFNLGFALGVVNLFVGAFNLIPLPPLDGSALLERLIPTRNLGSYYRVRQNLLIITMVVVLVDSQTTHLLSHLFVTLESWWWSLL
ncbi:MAG: site-2 protease family protein [Acidobacteria bacterium]|nr:site-2 protease family protein [Acidobacteriota bacterium]